MTRDVRIIGEKLKIVEIIDGKITKIIRDYHRTKEDKDEYIHEINYGKRGKYQKNKQVKGPDQYRKNLWKEKVNLGILKDDVLRLKSSTELLNNWAKNRGFKNYEEYINIISLGRGFTCYGEYEKVWMYYPGMPSPMKENRLDTRFLGIYIAENSIAKLFEGSQRMRYGNPGYDIICPKGYKLDVKAATLGIYNTFVFHINENMIADCFVLIGFNNIVELRPLYLWIIKNDEKINGCHVRSLNMITISNTPECLDTYRKYEKMDKLEKLKNICNEFDAKNKIEINDYTVPSKHLILDIVLKLRLAGKNEILPTDILHILEEKKKRENRRQNSYYII